MYSCGSLWPLPSADLVAAHEVAIFAEMNHSDASGGRARSLRRLRTRRWLRDKGGESAPLFAWRPDHQLTFPVICDHMKAIVEAEHRAPIAQMPMNRFFAGCAADLHGDIERGQALTLRGQSARNTGCSMTPARESVRRLVGRRGLTLFLVRARCHVELSNDGSRSLRPAGRSSRWSWPVRRPAARIGVESNDCRPSKRRCSATLRCRQDAVAISDKSGFLARFICAAAPAMLAMADTLVANGANDAGALCAGSNARTAAFHRLNHRGVERGDAPD